MITPEWIISGPDPRAVDFLVQKLDLPRVAAGMLVRRGFSDPGTAETFLNPSLKDLPDPFLLPDMDRAVDRLVRALNDSEPIVVFGDYDADGLTSTALVHEFLQSLGAEVSAYVPHRLDEGYGLNADALRKLAGQGAKLLVTVDCGVSNREEVALARSLGMDVVVTDHHQIPERLPEAAAVVDPQRRESRFPQKNLAGVGVAFFLAGGIRQVLRNQGTLDRKTQPELAPLLGLVAIGTIADVMPLTDVNRILVRVGLGHLVSPYQPGLAALKQVGAVEPDRPVTARDVAFRLAPRLNAAGRLDSPRPGLQLLLSRDAEEAGRLAAELERLNNQRRRLQGKTLKQALEMIEELGIEQARSIVLAREGWPRGVVGLAASKLADQFNKPTILLALEEGLARGSGRSIKGFNLYRALTFCQDHLIRFGGHEQAAGLTAEASCVTEIIRIFEEIAARDISEADLVRKLDIEAVTTLEELERIAEFLPYLAPFGEGNPEPVFALPDLTTVSAGCVGGDHLKMTLRQNGRTIEAMGFGLGARLPDLGRRVSIAVKRHTSTFRGRTTHGWTIVDVKKA